MNIELISIDQNWKDETTNYWYSVNDEQYAISDCNGQLTVLDRDGWPIDYNEHLHNEILTTLHPYYENEL